jgi:poly-gamma-glutamate capsule biosynthesis protein CapA/YwtB (metallophosphatase superfamily)
MERGVGHLMDVEHGKGQPKAKHRPEWVRLFLCGDVMTGRGIDQILPHPCDPRLHEPYVRDAREYLRLAEEANGPIPIPVSWDYIWGEALEIWDSMAPEVRIANLETSVTGDGEPSPLKGIHYRMNTENIECLQAAKIDIACMANNHVLDWGYHGLSDTMTALGQAGIATAGAGEDAAAARTPAIRPIGSRGRVLLFSVGLGTSGVPVEWAAGPDSAGVFFAPEASLELAQ